MSAPSATPVDGLGSSLPGPPSPLDAGSIQVLHCPLCPFMTLQYVRLMEHVTHHDKTTDITLLQCTSCSLVGTHRGLLTEHSRLRHSEVNIKVLSTMRISPGSQTSKSLSLPASCFLCEEKMADGDQLKAHLETFHNLFNVKSFKSPSCQANCHSGNAVGSNGCASSADLKKKEENERNRGDGEERVRSSHPPGLDNGSHDPECFPTDGTLIVQPSDAPLSLTNGFVKSESTVKRPKIDNLCATLGSRKRKMTIPFPSTALSSTYRPNTAQSHQLSVPTGHSTSLGTQPPTSSSNSLTSNPGNSVRSGEAVRVSTEAVWSSGYRPGLQQQHQNRQQVRDHLLQQRKMAINTMRRKRGRPPKLSLKALREDDIRELLRPFVLPSGDPPTYEWVILAASKPYATRVKETLLIQAYDTDGVQFFRNLLKSYYSLNQLCQYAWDATQRRGRPRGGLEADNHMIGPDGELIPLKTLKEEAFVMACLDLIPKLFKQAFPDNLPVFINRMLARIREQTYNGGVQNPITSLPYDLSFLNARLDSLGSRGENESDIMGDLSRDGTENVHWADCLEDPLTHAERALSGHFVSSSNSTTEVTICSATANEQSIPRSLLLQAYDSEPLRFLKNLIRLGIPHEELRQCTWKGMNTGRPRMGIDDQDISLNSQDATPVKRSLQDDARVQAYLQLVQDVCKQPLPTKIGAHMHQILSSIRNKYLISGQHQTLNFPITTPMATTNSGGANIVRAPQYFSSPSFDFQRQLPSLTPSTPVAVDLTVTSVKPRDQSETSPEETVLGSPSPDTFNQVPSQSSPLS